MSVTATAMCLIIYFETVLLSTPPALAIYYLSIDLVVGTELSTRSCLSIGEFSNV